MRPLLEESGRRERKLHTVPLVDEVYRLFGPNLFDEEASLNSEFSQTRSECRLVVWIKPCHSYIGNHYEIAGMASQPFLFVLLENPELLLQDFLSLSHGSPCV